MKTKLLLAVVVALLTTVVSPAMAQNYRPVGPAAMKCPEGFAKRIKGYLETQKAMGRGWRGRARSWV